MSDELAVEQAYVDNLFARIDAEVAAANDRLRAVMLRVDKSEPDPEALVERETEYHGLQAKLDRLAIAQLGLVFGRIDIATDEENIENPVPGRPDLERRYIGRMGLDDRDDNYRTLLLDWRAPMARPFYLATTAHPEGVEMRRHIRTRERTVTSIDDERLENSKLSAGVRPEGRAEVAGESALLEAIEAARTGHMGNIVETIQREQDTIIRDATRGLMVVEGGPGTGKTAVALHRVAYLLYSWRDQLARTGVLIVGPNRTFLEYISHVLPELGETGVVLSTIGDLYPGVTAQRAESLMVREVKGSEEMVNILREAVKAYQKVPEAPIQVTADGIRLEITPPMAAKSRTRARRSRRPHNDAFPLFREHLIGQLAAQMAETIGADPMGGKNLLSDGDVAQLHEDIADEPLVEDALRQLWPELNPEQVLSELLESRDAIANAARDYDEDTQAALFRHAGPWAASDAALLDELAVLIGVKDPATVQAEAEQSWREQVSEAQHALDILSSSGATDNDDEFDAEILSAYDVIDAEALAQRHRGRDIRSTADRAREDRAWTYGHVIVDEAQELTPMEWRMVMRRCPSRWMTLVGDPAQTGAPAGVDSWTDALEPFIGRRFQHHRLTVNYRTPSEIMDLAFTLLPHVAPDQKPAKTIRSSGWPVQFLPMEANPEEALAELIEADPSRIGVVICPDADVQADRRGVSSVKGLEFDHVVMLSPMEIVRQSPQGWQDLYVAVTRATQSLTVIGDWPVELGDELG